MHAQGNTMSKDGFGQVKCDEKSLIELLYPTLA